MRLKTMKARCWRGVDAARDTEEYTVSSIYITPTSMKDETCAAERDRIGRCRRRWTTQWGRWKACGPSASQPSPRELLRADCSLFHTHSRRFMISPRPEPLHWPPLDLPRRWSSLSPSLPLPSTILLCLSGPSSISPFFPPSLTPPLLTPC